MDKHMNDKLQEVYRINEQDAEVLVKKFEAEGDEENLKKAQADLEKWKSLLEEG